MNYFINKLVLRNFKRIPHFFKLEPKFHIEHDNYALIGKLSTSLLHDILTPLTSLSLTCEIGESYTKSIQPIIKNSSSQIQEYVHIMRDFMCEYQNTSLIHVNKEISKCILLLKHKAIEHNVQIQYIEFDQVYSFIHPLHIYQIIINLLSNAIEASSESETKKIILILKNERNNFYIECKDFGVGMCSKTLKKLGVQNFSTKSTSRGFGLYSVKHIVHKLLNGELYIKSEPLCGSLFSCRIPLLK